MNTTQAPRKNGNKFVTTEHVFVPNVGCYFRTLDIAKAKGCSPNGVGLWSEELQFDGATWFRAGNLNAWD